jgi:hypothetical protein
MREKLILLLGAVNPDLMKLAQAEIQSPDIEFEKRDSSRFIVLKSEQMLKTLFYVI